METLARLCVNRPVFATMLVVSLVVAGGFSYTTLGVDQFPTVDLPTVAVTVTNPGASPTEVETEITDIIEEQVNTISGIDELRSTSVEGSSQVIITFILEKNGDTAAQEVRDKVNLAAARLPETALDPVITKFDVGATPVLRLAVSAPLPLRDVTNIADKQIKQRIENITGVGQVQIIGGSEREIQIQVDPKKMKSYNVTVDMISNAVRTQNAEIPGGRIDEGTRELTVRTRGKLQKAEQFNDIAVTTRGNYVVKIKDIGRAVDAAEELRTASYLNSEPAITLTVSKQSGQNTVEVAKLVKERLEEIKPTLPDNFKIQVIGDQSVFIQASLDSITTHLIEGGFLASLIVFLFLWNFRSTIIAAIAIPVSLISTFAIMAAVGYTLNQITMLALTLMVGIVIDDAIVVLENIYRFVEEKGMSPYQAAIEGTKEIGLAVLATTLSLMAVFLPVGFMGGIVGRFMSSFGLTAAFAIAISMLVSFTLTPMLASKLIKTNEDKEVGGDFETYSEDGIKTDKSHSGDSKDSWWYRPIDQTYTWMLKWSMAHRWAIVALCALVIFSMVPLFMMVGVNFTPVDDQSAFEVSVRTTEGSTLAATKTVIERIASDVQTLPGVTDTLVTVGGGQGAVNSGGIYVRLTKIEDRELSQQDLMTKTREMLAEYPKELKMSVQPSGGVGGGGGSRNADVQYVISGPNIEQLGKYANEIAERSKAIPDATDIDTSLVIGKPEIRVEIDRAKANDLGVSVTSIASALNTMVAGQDITTFSQGDDQYDVVIRADRKYRTGEEGLKDMVVPSAKAGVITLDKVVHLEEGKGPSSIERLNRQRQVTIYANVKPGGSNTDVTSAMDKYLEELDLAPGYSAGVAGTSKELAKSAYYFGLAIALAFIFMYIILAAQFESFVHPITILLTLPLAVPFGLLSLIVFGQSLNIFSALGILLLFGIVKKNAILQIDHTRGLREHGMNRYDAIIQGNRDRLRPILMTTIALVAGMLPLVVSTGPGSGTNQSIGVLVVGGQSMCLLLTLLAVPVFYSLFEDFGELPMWQKLGNAYQNTTKGIGNAISGVFGKAKKSVSDAFESDSKVTDSSQEGSVEDRVSEDGYFENGFGNEDFGEDGFVKDDIDEDEVVKEGGPNE